MKLKLLFVVFFLLVSCKSNSSLRCLNKKNGVKLFLISHKTMSRYAYNAENFKKRYDYFFVPVSYDFDLMFDNYNDCIVKLESEKIIYKDGSSFGVIALAEFNFNQKIISLFFDADENYYINKKWHSKNDGVYYLLFKYFSDDLIHRSTIDSAKLNYIDRLWHPSSSNFR